MFVLRKTMNEALTLCNNSAQERVVVLATRYGDALSQVTALQKQLSAWLMNKTGDITPRQMAQMFYAQDDKWQAEFFNVMQEEVLAYHDSQPKDGAWANHPGVPAGEGQWYHATKLLTQEGFETIEAIYEHAKYHRES
jgi:hypothetical protein